MKKKILEFRFEVDIFGPIDDVICRLQKQADELRDNGFPDVYIKGEFDYEFVEATRLETDVEFNDRIEKERKDSAARIKKLKDEISSIEDDIESIKWEEFYEK